LGFVAYAVNGQMPDPQLLTHSQQERAKQLGRALEVYGVGAERGPQIVQLAKKDKYDVIIVPLSEESPGGPGQFLDETTQYILRMGLCGFFRAGVPAIPQEVEIS